MSRSDLTVGIIGGMGPAATAEFFKLLISCTPISRESDHLRVLVDSNPRVPSRTRAFLYGEESPVPMIRQSALNLLAAGAEILALPCNSAHYFLPEVCAESHLPFVDMIEQTSEAVCRLKQRPRRVGLIAGEVTVQSGLYHEPLAVRGIELINVTTIEQGTVRQIIEEVKSDSISMQTSQKLTSVMSALAARGAEAIIFGCTELPLVPLSAANLPEVVDSAHALARAISRIAKRRSSE